MRSPELCRRAEISYRQLDYWTRRGYIRPVGEDEDKARFPGSGAQREYSEGMMLKARWMGCLIKLGFSVNEAEVIATAVTMQDAKRVHLGHGVTLLLEPHTHSGGPRGTAHQP